MRKIGYTDSATIRMKRHFANQSYTGAYQVLVVLLLEHYHCQQHHYYAPRVNQIVEEHTINFLHQTRCSRKIVHVETLVPT